ncbi:MAG: glycosyltransferase family 4 protein [Anaerolineae bacterium]|nr:glycosyltransferase family 4 protein [Anaerolineae bacterium]
MKIAYFSPLPPQRSGIADFSAELLPELAPLVDVTIFHSTPEAISASLRSQFEIAPLDTFPDRQWEFDLPLYQMGNSALHAPLYKLLCRYPGVVELHDFVLHHFMEQQDYRRELGYALDVTAVWAQRSGRFVPDRDTIPLNNRVINSSLGIIAHSDTVARQVRALNAEVPVTTVPLPVAGDATGDLRAELGWPDDAVVFAHIGQITPNRQLETALRVFGRIHADQPQTRYLIVGQSLGIDVHRLIDSMPDVVRWIDFVPDLQLFLNWINSADVVVLLRHPTTGETSSAGLRALRSGKPLIVFDHGWYAELPNEVALRVPVLDEAELEKAMREMVNSAEKRRRMSAAARSLALSQHSARHTAERVAAFLAQRF